VRGYRIFSDDAVEHLLFIKHAQALGFTLKEIRELLGLRLGERSSCDEVRARATRKLTDVEAKIAALQRIQSALGGFIAACQARRPTARCPILQSLESAGHSIEKGSKRQCRLN
jgi:DNA-binding transcriptional MerR regulator